ncbi:MAG: hypothetical protein M9939_15485 [Mesorhizobium sp.]|nr:hypothetical protein [Mesorhizobium sp.]MCO5162534.1 hypothetical protein [Mesorhizobium sp.]
MVNLEISWRRLRRSDLQDLSTRISSASGRRDVLGKIDSILYSVQPETIADLDDVFALGAQFRSIWPDLPVNRISAAGTTAKVFQAGFEGIPFAEAIALVETAQHRFVPAAE